MLPRELRTREEKFVKGVLRCRRRCGGRRARDGLILSTYCCGGDLFFEPLLVEQIAVVAALLDQLVVRAELDDAPASSTAMRSALRAVETRWAISNRCATLHGFPQTGQDLPFGIGVDAGERVVKDEDARIAQNGAGDCGALLLAAGKRHAALADDGAEAAGNSKISLPM